MAMRQPPVLTAAQTQKGPMATTLPGPICRSLRRCRNYEICTKNGRGRPNVRHFVLSHVTVPNTAACCQAGFTRLRAIWRMPPTARRGGAGEVRMCLGAQLRQLPHTITRHPGFTLPDSQSEVSRSVSDIIADAPRVRRSYNKLVNNPLLEDYSLRYAPKKLPYLVVIRRRFRRARRHRLPGGSGDRRFSGGAVWLSERVLGNPRRRAGDLPDRYTDRLLLRQIST